MISQQPPHNKPTRPITLTMALALAAMIALAMLTWQHELLLASLLLLAGALIGYPLGRSAVAAPRQHPAAQPEPASTAQHTPHATAEPASAGPQPAPQPAASLLAVLDELQTLQDVDDLLDRYQAFLRVVEATLNHALGPVNVSLWCPDTDYRTLIECLIPAAHKAHGRSASALLTTDRPACVVPFDSPAIRHALQTGQPYLNDHHQFPQISAASPRHTSLPSDACLWLEREFGCPLLVNVQFAQTCPTQRDPQTFKSASRLIDLYWRQLQAANQRQWRAEHDQATGALHPDQFLRHSQAWARDLDHADEPFALVTLAVNGFRATFARSAQHWRQTTVHLAARLRDTLANATPHYLLGKMADDVFAIFLPGKDAFLAQLLVNTINEQITQPPTPMDPAQSLLANLQLRWALGDHNQYADDLEGLLNELYRRLFQAAASAADRTALPTHQPEEITCPCK